MQRHAMTCNTGLIQSVGREVEEKEENEENLSIALDNQLHVFGLKMQAKPGIPSHRNAVVGGGCGIHSLLDEAMTGVSTFDEARRGTQGGGHHWTRG